jgi:DNA-binding MarR family transcriptional regulator
MVSRPRTSPRAGSGIPSADGLGGHLPDELVDTLDKAFRRLRKAMIRPPAGLVPVPSLGRQLDIAKIFACDAVSELAETQASVSVKDVATTLDLDHSTVSRLLGEVEADGLLVRAQDTADRRRTTVSLTALGTAVVADATAMTRFFSRLLLADWPRQDVEDLQRLLTRLADTVAAKLDVLPEIAMAELARANPALAEAAADIARQAQSRSDRTAG